MNISKAGNALINRYPYINKAGIRGMEKRGSFTENLQNSEESSTKERENRLTGKMSSALEEKAQGNDGKESKASIIVKPDGSKVLLVTTGFGGMETTMSIEISKPAEMQNDNSDVPISEMDMIPKETEGFFQSLKYTATVP